MLPALPVCPASWSLVDRTSSVLNHGTHMAVPSWTSTRKALTQADWDKSFSPNQDSSFTLKVKL